MFRSLRFRLPALFLAGIVLAGLVSTAIAFRLLQSYSRSQSFKELNRESAGLTELYAEQAIKATREGREGPSFSAAQLEKATGDSLYYVGSPIFFTDSNPPLRELKRSDVNWNALVDGKIVRFEFR